MIDKIKKRIAEGTTKRHVPKHIKQVTAIPYTISGKKVELAVQRMIHGLPVPNRDALAGWLQARQRERVAKEIHRFALDFAGTELDIDPELAQAGVEHLLAADAR